MKLNLTKEDSKQWRIENKARNEKELEALTRNMPFSLKELVALLRYLQENSQTGDPGHSLNDTETFIAQHNLDREKALEWLIKNGGACDCQIIEKLFSQVGYLIGFRHLWDEFPQEIVAVSDESYRLLAEDLASIRFAGESWLRIGPIDFDMNCTADAARNVLENFATSFGFKEQKLCWYELEEVDALEQLLALIKTEDAYDTDLMTQDEANEYLTEILQHIAEPRRYFCNFTRYQKVVGSRIITTGHSGGSFIRHEFARGILLASATKAALYCAYDED